MPWAKDRSGRLFKTGSTPAATAPVLNSVLPSSAVSGTPRVRSCVGSNFVASSQVFMDGTVAPESTFVSETQMSYKDPAAVVGSHTITVRTGSLESSPVTVEVTAPPEGNGEE